MKKKMPAQKRHRSKQDYGTPWDFIDAVERRFGPVVHDLAAHAKNAKSSSYYSKKDDALTKPWAKDFPKGLLWLNPEFGDIGPWAKKCAEESAGRDGIIVMLTPASVGTNWFHDHVHRKARVETLSPRIVFQGETHAFPKDLMVAIFGPACGGFGRWFWRAP